MSRDVEAPLSWAAPAPAPSPEESWRQRYMELREWAEANGWLDKALRSFAVAVPSRAPEPERYHSVRCAQCWEQLYKGEVLAHEVAYALIEQHRAAAHPPSGAAPTASRAPEPAKEKSCSAITNDSGSTSVLQSSSALPSGTSSTPLLVAAEAPAPLTTEGGDLDAIKAVQEEITDWLRRHGHTHAAGDIVREIERKLKSAVKKDRAALVATQKEKETK